MSRALELEEQQADAVASDPIAALNYEVENIEAGIIKLVVDKIAEQVIYETIIKTDAGIEYVLRQDEIKMLEMQDDGQVTEMPLAAEDAVIEQVAEAIKSTIQAIEQSSIEQCCANIKAIALRPSFTPDFIKIFEPRTAEECHEFLISVAEDDDYIMIDDDCPYILRRIALADDEEQLTVLKPSEFVEVVAKINQKIEPILAQEAIEDAEITELTKDAELRQELIGSLWQEVQSLTACVAICDDAGEVLGIQTANHVYAVRPNQISMIDAISGEIDLSSKSDRFMLQEAAAAINEACAIISAQSEAINQCYNDVAALAELEDKPNFITKYEAEEEGGAPYFTIEVDGLFYVMTMDERGCCNIFHQDENMDEPTFLAPQEIESFVAGVNGLVVVEEELF